MKMCTNFGFTFPQNKKSPEQSHQGPFKSAHPLQDSSLPLTSQSGNPQSASTGPFPLVLRIHTGENKRQWEHLTQNTGKENNSLNLWRSVLCVKCANTLCPAQWSRFHRIEGCCSSIYLLPLPEVTLTNILPITRDTESTIIPVSSWAKVLNIRCENMRYFSPSFFPIRPENTPASTFHLPWLFLISIQYCAKIKNINLPIHFQHLEMTVLNLTSNQEKQTKITQKPKARMWGNRKEHCK